jgi:hypothetical protein
MAGKIYKGNLHGSHSKDEYFENPPVRAITVKV